MNVANKLTEALEIEAHNKFFREHSSEDPFPLDGSNWSRLVALRLHRIRHPHCCTWENLLTRLHSSNSPLEHEHYYQSAYLNYWFLNPYLHYVDLRAGGESGAASFDRWSDVALRSVLPEVLEEAEKQWVHPVSKMFEPSPAKFWVDEVAHDWHSGAFKGVSKTSASLPLNSRLACKAIEQDSSGEPESQLQDELLVNEKDCEDYLLEVDRRTLESLMTPESSVVLPPSDADAGEQNESD